MQHFFLKALLSVVFSVRGVAQIDEQKKLEIDDFISQTDKPFEKPKKSFDR